MALAIFTNAGGALDWQDPANWSGATGAGGLPGPDDTADIQGYAVCIGNNMDGSTIPGPALIEDTVGGGTVEFTEYNGNVSTTTTFDSTISYVYLDGSNTLSNATFNCTVMDSGTAPNPGNNTFSSGYIATLNMSATNGSLFNGTNFGTINDISNGANYYQDGTVGTLYDNASGSNWYAGTVIGALALTFVYTGVMPYSLSPEPTDKLSLDGGNTWYYTAADPSVVSPAYVLSGYYNLGVEGEYLGLTADEIQAACAAAILATTPLAPTQAVTFGNTSIATVTTLTNPPLQPTAAPTWAPTVAPRYWPTAAPTWFTVTYAPLNPTSASTIAPLIAANAPTKTDLTATQGSLAANIAALPVPPTIGAISGTVAAAIAAAALATSAQAGTIESDLGELATAVSDLGTPQQAGSPVTSATDALTVTGTTAPGWYSPSGGGATAEQVWEYATRTLSGYSGAQPAQAVGTDEDVYITCPLGGTKGLWRVIYFNGNLVQQSDLASIAYTIYRSDPNNSETREPVSGHESFALSVSSTIFDALQTNGLWAVYNFFATPSALVNPCYPNIGTYLVEVTLTPNIGEKIIARWWVRVT